MTTPKDDNKIRFDKTINLGHILTVLMFLVTAIVSWNMIDKRVLVLEEFRMAQRERDAMQDAFSKEKFQEVRDALNDLRHSVEKVADKIGAK